MPVLTVDPRKVYLKGHQTFALHAEGSRLLIRVLEKIPFLKISNLFLNIILMFDIFLSVLHLPFCFTFSFLVFFLVCGEIKNK